MDDFEGKVLLTKLEVGKGKNMKLARQCEIFLLLLF